MKNKFKLIALSLSLLFVSSCDNWLELRPENDIILEDFWQTKSDVESVLAACYRGMTERACIDRMMIWGELRSDNIVDGKGFPSDLYDIRRILYGDLTAHNAYNRWSSFYSVINTCNTLLHYAPLVVDLDDNFTERDLRYVEGEALTIRALAYFYLVRAFRDIPWIDDPSISDTQDFSDKQTPENEVLNNIIRDLKYVQDHGYIRDSYGNSIYDKGRITRSSLNALLADVYLWKGDYENCIDACDIVLADPNLSLVTSSDQMLGQIFSRGNSTESIFELQFAVDNMENTAVKVFYGSQDDPNGYFAFPTALAYNRHLAEPKPGSSSPFYYRLPDMTYESTKDARCDYYVRPYGGSFSILKYAANNVLMTQVSSATSFTYSYRSGTSNWIVYRLPDIMLLKAEALIFSSRGSQTDNWNTAINLVNAVYQRSNPEDPALRAQNYTTQIALEELVLRERQRELLFEGKRWFDLVRMVRRDETKLTTLNSLVIAKMDNSTAPIGAVVLDAMYMPISQSELDANKNLVQNKYYETSSSNSLN